MLTRIVDEKSKMWMRNQLPSYDKWTYRTIKNVSPNSWYRKGDLVKIKSFGTFGAYDYKDRWVGYWDVSYELKPKWWYAIKFWFKQIIS